MDQAITRRELAAGVIGDDGTAAIWRLVLALSLDSRAAERFKHNQPSTELLLIGVIAPDRMVLARRLTVPTDLP